jgi:peptidoglycan/xylan/chitin deacetylase (PgdA/CDA1 family)
VAPLDLFGRTIARPALRLRARLSRRWLTVLLYHRVLPAPGSSFDLDRGVVDSGPHSFDRHMGLLAAACNPIDLAQLLAFQRGEAELPDNPVLVTFDDGYLDNRQHALPILQRHGIRALFFVATTYVDKRRLFWWDRLAYLFKHANSPVAHLSYPTELVLDVKRDRKASSRTALKIIKTTRGLDLDRFLGELAAALEVPWDEALERRLADRCIMTWDDVRALRAGGMDVGSHTRTHRVLDTVEPGQLTDELAASKADIERELGEKIASISYPVGRAIRRLPIIERAVRDAGYEIGFSVESHANPLSRSAFDPFNVSRLPVHLGLSRARLAAWLAAPEMLGAA